MAKAPKSDSESTPGTNKVAEARNRNLDLAIQQIQKDFGEGSI
ncbi:MAG: Protein RecA, partial [Verrucomicrobiaceae bacterium]|nr:Protein RecA [Verrucomicrobiaceae bacterium]